MAADASFAAVTNKNVVNTIAVQEMIFQTGGMSAESETGGVQINVVPKEGGNNFSYYFKAEGTGSNMQSVNLTDELKARGLADPPSVKKIYDFGGAVGGPFAKDKVWFFLATRMWDRRTTPRQTTSTRRRASIGSRTAASRSTRLIWIVRPTRTGT